MLITYEVLNEDTLPILEQLERLHLLRRVPETSSKNGSTSSLKPDSTKEPLVEEKKTQPAQNKTAIRPAKKASVPLREKSLAGSISPETAQKLREHLETVRNEWEHRI